MDSCRVTNSSRSSHSCAVVSCIWFQLPMLPYESRTERKRRFLFNKSCGHAAWKLLDLCLPPVNLMRAAIDVGSAKKTGGADPGSIRHVISKILDHPCIAVIG